MSSYLRDTTLDSDKQEARRKAMENFVGSWKDRDDIPDGVEYVRNLRRDDRLERV